MYKKRTVVIGFLGTKLDGYFRDRWDHWRPTISIGLSEDMVVDRYELLYDGTFHQLADMVAADFKQISPETDFRQHAIELGNPWDFQTVYSGIYDFFKDYPFDPENEEYLIHITTGTHVIQICLFLLAESRHIPGKILQTQMKEKIGPYGIMTIIDLDLSKYDKIAERFHQEEKAATHFLTAGIETKNPAFNRMIRELAIVSGKSVSPILLTGATGVGKTKMARLVYEWKKQKRVVQGGFVELNCATLKGESSMSTLFGHVKGAYTGAVEKRNGFLSAANGGLLFLDEIGELGLDEQAMLLRAIEEKRFYPLGSDTEVKSDFQLICGTNRDLRQLVREGRFREDLLARIQMWTFKIPSLKERKEDIEPNLDYEIRQAATRTGTKIGFSKEAKKLFLSLATSGEALWKANFRDLSGAVTRMTTLSEGGRITEDDVLKEWQRLTEQWKEGKAEQLPELTESESLVNRLLGSRAKELDVFDKVQLEEVLKVCLESENLAQASRKLFAHSLKEKKSINNSDRLRKYLAKYGLDWRAIRDRS